MQKTDYNLLEYSENYSISSGSLWNYNWYEVNYAANKIDAANNKINNSKTTRSEPFEYNNK